MRVILTLAVLAGALVVRTFWFPVSMIGNGIAAGGQLASSDMSAVTSITAMGFFVSMTGLITIITLGLLIAIWYLPIKRCITKMVEEV